MSTSDQANTVEARIKELERSCAEYEGDVKFYSSDYYVDSVLSGSPLSPASSSEEYLARSDRLITRNYLDSFATILEDIPISMGSRSLAPHPARVGIIADEFLFKSFHRTADIVAITPENYMDLSGSLDLLIIASTWKGLAGEWKGLSGERSRARNILINQLIPAFRLAGVPISFYSKEDPPNYELFVDIAKNADFIFTSAAEVIDRYRADCPGVKAVRTLRFGVNPHHHNPVGSRKYRRAEVSFAGSWHTHKYEERRAAAEQIFEGVNLSNRPLVIIDRNSELRNDRYFFPEYLLPYVSPSINHDTLLKIQKMTDFSINLNSVSSSMSMYANRVVELQAMGSLVISNYSPGVNDQFPNVFISENALEVRDFIDNITSDEAYRSQMDGLRNVFTNHLSFDRMGEILRTAGLPARSSRPRVAAVGEDSDENREVVQTQTISNVPLLSVSEARVRKQDFDIYIPISSAMRYAATHFEDMVNAFAYADVDFVTKGDPEGDGPLGHAPIHNLSNPQIGALWVNSSPCDLFLSNEQIEGSGYVMDHFGYSARAETEVPIDYPLRKKLSVIIPVYNNGRFLRDKCFRSLKRSSLFGEMEIILVDDGSSDYETIEVLNFLSSSHSNVRLYRFEKGGSGSASRPRNKGLELASCEWVTYLDPDNEAVNDGYSKLVALASERKLEFAIGDMVKLTDRTHLSKNSERLMGATGLVLENSESGRAALTRIQFHPMSIQAMVLDARWLKSLNLVQPVGALGQDSYFFQQILFHAGRFGGMSVPIHVYYGAVSNSMVNVVGPSFFRKYLPLEKARVGWLEDVGLMDAYKESRAQTFMKGWYLKKLSVVSPSDREECESLVRRIAEFYSPIEWRDSEVRSFFQASERFDS
ncbi:glycosyltransferase [Arthrobacter sp. Bz4]|uniref:glycosyltransferase n=1 Tax=Arthrobacter sp. Bz4 TaxID=2171979 RepID=UPI000D525178|nr:glycosyltransferase [Arthrobacter sp. Bz4]PVE15870.1 glycosyltransferase [Arthrobacter sp. Bz4]